MKKNPIIVIKNIFCIITVIWSAIMLAEYSAALLPDSLSSILFEILDSFLIFLYLGIWVVPILLLVSIILMAVVGKKYKNTDNTKSLNIVTIALPVMIFLLMILSNFNSLLQ